MILRLWAEPDTRAPLLALLRSAVTDEQANATSRQILTGAVHTATAEVRDSSGPRTSSAAAARGKRVAPLRYVLEVPPMSAATEDETAAPAGPVPQCHLDGGQPAAAP
ncbi:hypothetical protein JHE00_17450 [Prauserella sp. ASG 168]|uniref:Tetracyclin repressor-like C-terminal domain-containing protein n=2 Tax=Prauserella cavernicola TaxID=2800127 RepID=A0A934V2M4_9PSEU|nr:hypothetical protein [Prauserella cavernicola]